MHKIINVYILYIYCQSRKYIRVTNLIGNKNKLKLCFLVETSKFLVAINEKFYVEETLKF